MLVMGQIDQAWVQIVIQLGSFGVLAIFLIAYIPKLAAQAFKVHQEALALYRQDLEFLRQTFRTEVEAVRVGDRQAFDQISSRVEKLQEALLESQRQQYEEMGQMIKSISDFRSIVEKAVEANYRMRPQQESKP